MTPRPPDDPHLRNIARDVRFLSYRAGAPNPVSRWLFLAMLAPLVLIVAIGFFIEIAIQFHLIKPVPRHVHPTEERWPASNPSRSSTRVPIADPYSLIQPQQPTGETK
jgi:hypothetical protein